MRTRITITAMSLFLVLCGCGSGEQHGTPEVRVLPVDALPEDTADPVWDDAPFHDAELTLQDLVEPRLLEPSTPRMRVRAVTDGDRIAFRMRWVDETRDDRPGASRFSDACAVQLPASAGADVPAPQMGEEGRIVEIAYWRASWQAVVDGREDTIAALYPNARIDHYPFEAPSLEIGSPEQQALAAQYAPARALGQAMEGPRQRPVEDLIAQGPGTLSPATEQRSTGRGSREDTGWQVMIVRPLPDSLDGSGRSQIAFAVWDGDRDEVGARKMRSVWIPIHVKRGDDAS